VGYGLFRAAIEFAILLSLVNMAVMFVWSGYIEGHLVGTVVCSGMGFIERLWS